MAEAIGIDPSEAAYGYDVGRARVLGALAEIEWGGRYASGCPSCGAERPPHAISCEVGAALNYVEAEEDPL